LGWSTLLRTESYSQFGEDKLLDALRKQIPSIPKNYIGVGANEPLHRSNTFLLYTHGFRGLVIEANQELLDLHRDQRPGDTQVCALVGDKRTEQIFAVNKTHELSRVCEDEESLPEGTIKVERRIVESLDDIIGRVMPDLGEVGVLCVDCEGYDLKVLQGLNWKRHSPWVVVVEESEISMGEFLKQLGYRILETCQISGVYVSNAKIPIIH
jgi:FkbM family methyltransferase